MARGRRAKKTLSISLFPFLSVLVCAMGVMIIIITGQNLLALGQTADQLMEIAGSEQEKQPVYVECDSDGILIHPERTAVPLTALKGDGPTAFHRLLDTLKASAGKRYLVLLIRPDGIDAFERCFAMAEDHDIQVGKDVLYSGGRLILTQDGKPVLAK
ncbi:MAG: hypothetical protein ACK4RK_17800 [Gemmataceae bacterium]